MQRRSVWGIGLALLVLAGEVFAQASPFSTGTTAFQGSFLAILTPVAVIAVMALGLAAWFNRISWGWAVAGVVGIVLVLRFLALPASNFGKVEVVELRRPFLKHGVD